MEESESEVQNKSQQTNMETEIHLTCKKRVVFWLYLWIGLCFLTGTIYLIASSWAPMIAFKGTDEYYYADQVARQWQVGFLNDVRITNDGTCPLNYDYALNYNWPGTTLGCYCISSSNLSFVLSGYCSPTLIQSNCSNVPPQLPIVAHQWRNVSTLCIRRSTTSFLTQPKFDGTSAVKACGNSQSVVIVPTAEPCPFVNASFSSLPLEDYTTVANDPNNALPPLNIAFNSTSPYSFNSYPISKFTVSQYAFCLINQDTGVSPSHSDFILLKQTRGCANQSNFTFLDSMTEVQYYANNAALNALSAINGFPRLGNWDYNLGYASLPSWKYKCRHNYNNKFSMPNAIAQFTMQFTQLYESIVYVEAVFCIVLGTLILILALRRCINSAVYPVGFKQQRMTAHFMKVLLRYIIDLVCKLVLLGCSFTCLWSAYSNYNWFQAAGNLNCADGNQQLINSVIIPFRNLYAQLFKLFLAQVLLTFFILIIDIVHFVYAYRSELSHYLLQSEEKLMIKDGADPLWEDDPKYMELQKDQFKEDGNKEQEFLQEDQFRVTMAQNVFSSKRNSTKLRKKKGKKIIKRDLFRNETPSVNYNALEESSGIFQ